VLVSADYSITCAGECVVIGQNLLRSLRVRLDPKLALSSSLWLESAWMRDDIRYYREGKGYGMGFAAGMSARGDE
jgi:hypothetical protein